MAQIQVQVYTHHSRSNGSYERIAEITGLGEDVFVQCNYRDGEQVAAAVRKACGMPIEVHLLRSVEPVAGDFADFRRFAKEHLVESEIARNIKAAL